MPPKKLEPEEAFDLLTRHARPQEPTEEMQELEDGFGTPSEEEDIPAWRRYFRKLVLAGVAAALVAGVGFFYWQVVRQPEAQLAEPADPSKESLAIPPEEAKKIIEANLRHFLSAQLVEEKLPYIISPAEERGSLEIYYQQRGLHDSPLWKIQRISPVKSGSGEVWFVLYQDVERRVKAASFERVGDDYLLHWSAMKAFCELPWEKFIVEKPKEPKVMRGYLRQYTGVFPLGVSAQDHACFLIEDRAAIFSELAIMKLDAPGCSTLKKLAKGGRHPVTLELFYQTPNNDSTNKRLVVRALKHLRWQKMSTTPVLAP
ncbi:MAG: hypothetical protein ACPG32_11525 [Akkermansiaceae bacterium]